MMKSMQDELKARRVADFYKAWEEHKRLGFAATQEEVNRIAALHGIEPPTLGPIPSQVSSQPARNGTLHIDFENKGESAVLVAYLAAKAVVGLHFDLLMYVNIITNELRAPGSDLPAERIHKLVEHTDKWAKRFFGLLGVSVRYED
jgi:hypothetical protein